MTVTENQLHIYTSQGKYVDSIPYSLEEVQASPYDYYPNYVPSMILTHTLYDFPIIDEVSGQLREMNEVEQVQSGQRKLKQGEKIFGDKIEKVPIPDHIVVAGWNPNKLEWEEMAGSDKLKEEQKRRIDLYKAERRAAGYTWRKSEEDREPYIQKGRDTDILLIGQSISFLEDSRQLGFTKEEFINAAKVYGFNTDIFQKIYWSFNDKIQVALSEQDLRSLRIYGSLFTQVVFNVEAQWKASPVNLKTQTYENFDKAVTDAYNTMSRALTQTVHDLSKNKE